MQVLTDTYGRILTQYTQDGDYRTACVYVTGDGRLDWDDASEPELIRLLGKYGYNDALTIEGNNVTINDNGETEMLIWDDAAMDFTVGVDMFQNGTQNMYFRTVNDGSRDVTVLVDADGKAIMAPTVGEYTDVLFNVANNGTEIDTITEGSLISATGIIQACGGSVNVTALDAGSSVFLLVMGTHVQYCNADNLSTTPSVTELPRPTALYDRDGWCVDENSRVVTTDNGFIKKSNNQWTEWTGGSPPAGWGYIRLPYTNAEPGLKWEYGGIEYVLRSGVFTPALTTW